jgi:phosphatidylglycerol:prolipoprotein diacylglycerol transferase
MLPILYQSPEFILYSYPLLMGLGWGIAYQVYFSLLDPSYSKIKGQILFWGIFISAWLGAKFLFYLTYPKDLDSSFLGQISFWTGGGFVFYGGLIAGVLFVALYRLWDKNLSLNILWAMLPAVAFGHGVGRIGCFLAGCCFGKPTELFWGVYLHEAYRHPTQLLEAILLLALGFFLYYSKRARYDLITSYILTYGVLRLLVEGLRGDGVRGEWGILTPSQWISLGLIAAALIMYLFKKFKRLQSPK